MQYKIIYKGDFERLSSFEKRLNALAANGWKVITGMGQRGYLVLGKEKH